MRCWLLITNKVKSRVGILDLHFQKRMMIILFKDIDHFRTHRTVKLTNSGCHAVLLSGTTEQREIAISNS